MMDVICELLEETRAEGWTLRNWMVCFLQAVGGALMIMAILLVMLLILGS